MAENLPIDVIEHLFLFLEHSTAHEAKRVCAKWYWASKRYLPMICAHKWEGYAVGRNLPTRFPDDNGAYRLHTHYWSPDNVFYWANIDTRRKITHLYNSRQTHVTIRGGKGIEFVRGATHGVFAAIDKSLYTIQKRSLEADTGCRAPFTLCWVGHNGELKELVNGCVYVATTTAGKLIVISNIDATQRRARIIDERSLKTVKSVVFPSEPAWFTFQDGAFGCMLPKHRTIWPERFKPLFTGGLVQRRCSPRGAHSSKFLDTTETSFVTRGHRIVTAGYHGLCPSPKGDKVAVLTIRGDVLIY